MGEWEAGQHEAAGLIGGFELVLASDGGSGKRREGGDWGGGLGVNRDRG